MTAAVQALWEAYGHPDAGPLHADRAARLVGLATRPELNGLEATVLDWDGRVGRFFVAVGEEKIKVRAANLLVDAAGGDWLARPVPGLPLRPDLAIAMARGLPARTLAALSGSCRGLRATLWRADRARGLWEGLLGQLLGDLAVSVARSARPGAAGPTLYRAACALRLLFRQRLEVVQGGVQKRAHGMEVVACPCTRAMHNVGVGAQGAVRAAAGEDLEAAVSRLGRPLPALSVVLVPGGQLAKRVAMCVTEPPRELWQRLQGGRQEQFRAVLGFLTDLHGQLLREVRHSGFRTLAMPTLCTGGMRMPPQMVALAVAHAVRKDFCENPTDPLWVRVACFEAEQLPLFRAWKDWVLQSFYRSELPEHSFLLEPPSEP